MVRYQWQLAFLGVAVLLTACERPAEPGRTAPNSGVLPATASSQDFGDYVVHFNALTTDQLTAQVAREYGIVRSPSRAMLNVSVLQTQDNAVGTPVQARVSASAVNLTGQFRNIALREVAEGDAVYYIGEVGVSHQETLIFTLDVTPAGETQPLSVRFMKQFFVQ